ncbi:hypothetical protein BH09MYX1_BH09MYX1_33760 [soil metagenome]
MTRSLKLYFANVLLVVAFVAFGLARPQHALAGQVYSPAGEGASGSLAIPTQNGSGGGGLIGVDETRGAATASLGFEVPPARGVSTPALGLSYVAGIDGVGGYGWDLPIPAIERSTVSNAPVGDGPISDSGDRFTFGGEVLVPLCIVGVACPGNEHYAPWASGWVYYRAQNDGNRARYFWSPGHERWRVEYPSGENEDYGVLYGDLSAVDRYVDYYSGTSPYIFRWNLVRRYSAGQAKNYVAYRWANDTRGPEYLRGYLSDIYYTPTLDAPLEGSIYNATFAHHVHFEYDRSPTPSYHPDWQGPGGRRHAPPRTYRLAHVDVSSAPIDDVGPRAQVRRYWLSYENHGPRRSVLVSMFTEGSRDGAGNPAYEDASGQLPSSASLLMATSQTVLEYTPQVYSSAVTQLSPPLVANNVPVIVKDVTGDGVPDLLQPASAVFTNGAIDGDAVLVGEWSPTQHRPTFVDRYQRLFEPSANPYPTCPVDAAAFLGKGSQTMLGEFSGRNETLGIFRGSLKNCVFPAEASTSSPIFKPRVAQATVDDDPSTFDIQNVAGDIDGDGLLDTIGRDPGAGHPWNETGDILLSGKRHGQVHLTGTQVMYGDSFNTASQFADFDGDGCADAYTLPDGTQGYGLQWKPSECNCHYYRNSPYNLVSTDVDADAGPNTKAADVDADGLADIINQVGASIRIRLNNGDGTSFGGTGREFSFAIPSSYLTTAPKITFADMNASGTTDVVVLGQANQLLYFDLLESAPGVDRPLQLKSITNGLGAKTTVTYGRANDLDAQFGWSTHSRIPFDVVRTVETDAGSGMSASAYFYYDPVYDAWNQRVRGFRRVRVRSANGVDASAIQHTHRLTYYAIGSCGSLQDECPLDKDPEQDSLTTLGLPYRVDVFSDADHVAPTDPALPPNPVPLSTTLTSYALVSVRGMDFRTSTRSEVEQVDTFLYDANGAAQTMTGTILHGSIGVGTDALTTVTVGDPTTTVNTKGEHLRKRFNYDAFGNTIVSHDDGRVGIDRTIDQLTDWDVAPNSSWTWRAFRTRTPRFTPAPGDRPTFDREMFFDFDSAGRVTATHAVLDGVVALDRHHTNPTKAIAQAPASAAQNGLITVVQMTYDVLGNVDTATDSSGTCRSWRYDKAFQSLPIESTIWAGACNGNGARFTTTTLWDRGLNAPLRIDRPDGRVSTFDFDAFGRLENVYAPDPQVLGLTVLAGHFRYFDPTLSGEYILPARIHATGPAVDTWTYLDGFGKGMHSLRRADPTQGDGGTWIVEGYFSHLSDRELASYEPWFYSEDPLLFVGQGSGGAGRTRAVADAYGRTVATYERDGTVVGTASYHGLAVDSTDESGAAFTSLSDGHGNVIESRVTLGPTKKVTTYGHLATGETTEIREFPQSTPGDVVYRWMGYDSLGHLVENGEPNSTKDFGPSANLNQTPWRYAYDTVGRLVGTSDARGCGKNIFYDSVGRAVAEDWSPCDDAQADYTTPNLATGDGTESFTVYDGPEVGQDAPAGATVYRGHAAAIYDRGAHTQLNLDGRARAVTATKWIAKPGTASALLVARYAPHAYRTDTVFDLANRVTSATTGADVPELLSSGQSATSVTYTARGVVGAIGSSYGPLAGAMTYDADGLPRSVVYNDLASTTATSHYDTRRRIDRYQLLRGAPSTWEAPVSVGQSIPTALADEAYHYDSAGNLSAIDDFRLGYEWPVGAKPVNRSYQHDDQKQLTRVDYAYPSGVDSQVSPFSAEEAATSSAPIPRALISTRPTFQSYTYDAHGRPATADDDQHATWDRSLTLPTFGTTKPHAISSAANGKLEANYDDAGNTVRMDVDRLVSCSAPSGKCAQVFAYEWDEVGELARARRWDVVTIPSALPAEAPVAELRYTYSGGARVVRENRSAPTTTYFVDIFGSLRLEHTTWDGTDYARTASTEAVYLAGFARLVDDASLPNTTTASLHVVFTMGDVLGSTSTVIDGATGELMERTTYQAYGATDSDLRPARWGSFRESFRFTGKEDDIEVGLQYFGARYYAPNLGRWLSPDPLMVHGVGPELDVYSYVGGQPEGAVDPNGLCWGSLGKEGCVDSGGGGGGGDVSQIFEWGSNDSAHGEGAHYDGWVGASAPTPSHNASVSFPGCTIARGFNVLGYSPSRPFPWQRPIPVDFEGFAASFAGATLISAVTVGVALGAWVAVAELAAVIEIVPGLVIQGEFGAAAITPLTTAPITTMVVSGAVAGVNDPLSINGALEGGIAAEAGGGGGATLFHGTDVSSARGFLAGAELDSGAAAAAKIDGAPGFFLATAAEDAAYFAARRGSGTVLQYSFSPTAVQRLGGLRATPLGPLGKIGQFAGGEAVVGTESFGVFNSLRQSGHITVTPFHF